MQAQGLFATLLHSKAHDTNTCNQLMSSTQVIALLKHESQAARKMLHLQTQLLTPDRIS